MCRILFLGAASSCHVARWVGWLRDRGHDVVVGTLHPSRSGVFTDGVRLLTTQGFTGHASAHVLPAAARAARRLYREFRPHVVIAYYMSSYGLLARLARLHPCVGVAAGGDVLVDPWDSALQRVRNRIVGSWIVRGCSRMLVWAPHVADRLVQMGYPARQILVQPRGVDRRLFAYREPRRRADGESVRILSTRWLKPLYQVDTLVRALARLARKGVPFEASLVGSGSEGRPLMDLAAREGIADRVAFKGRLAAAEMPELMRWADVYVSTSSSDGASSSLFEALATGVYPIVTDIPANAYFVEDGVHGDLFPVGDAAALAERLERLTFDESRRLASIRAARRLVEERLDFDRNLARIESFVCGNELPGNAKAGVRSRDTVRARL